MVHRLWTSIMSMIFFLSCRVSWVFAVVRHFAWNHWLIMIDCTIKHSLAIETNIMSTTGNHAASSLLLKGNGTVNLTTDGSTVHPSHLLWMWHKPCPLSHWLPGRCNLRDCGKTLSPPSPPSTTDTSLTDLLGDII